jgi:hypothetical protein
VRKIKEVLRLKFEVGLGFGRSPAVARLASAPHMSIYSEPLRFRRDRVEDQRALPVALDAGEHGDLSTGNVERDVLEIVLACATHFDVAERRAR